MGRVFGYTDECNDILLQISLMFLVWTSKLFEKDTFLAFLWNQWSRLRISRKLNQRRWEKGSYSRNLLWSSGHIGVRCLRRGDSQCDYYAHDVQRSNAGKGMGGVWRGWGGKGEGREEENQGLLMAAVKHSLHGALLYHITNIRRPKVTTTKTEEEKF